MPARDRPPRAMCTALTDEDARPRSLCADELGTARAKFRTVMRHDDEDDRKKPQPIAVPKKRSNALEAPEHHPGPLSKEHDRDRHRHVA